MKKFFCFIFILLTFFCVGCENDVKKSTDESSASSQSPTIPEDPVESDQIELTYSSHNDDNNSYGQSYDFTIKNNTSSSINSWKVVFPILNNKYPNQYDNNSIPSVWGSDVEIFLVDKTIELYSSKTLSSGEVFTGFGMWVLFDSLDFDGYKIFVNCEKPVSNGSSSGGDENDEIIQGEEPIKVPTVVGGSFTEHGKLQVIGTKLQDKNKNDFILRGVSTHGINWDCGEPFVRKEAFNNLRDEWGCNAVRLALYTVEYNGYCSGGNKTELENIIANGVQYATELGMYVIIDWHILNDHTPQTHKAEAKAFFTKMASRYANYDNVLYEICNEPNGGTGWPEIKSYAEEIIPIIRQYAKDSVIIVGTPNWSQDVDIASQNKISSENSHNVMYTIHFYSGTHFQSFRDKVQIALNNGLPVFCTEFGVSKADGNGGVFKEEAVKWLDFFDDNKISYFCWAFANKNESSNLIKSGQVGWSEQYRSEAGNWIVMQYNLRNAK